MTEPFLRGEVELLPLDSVRPNGWNPNVVPPHIMASIRAGFLEDGWLVSQALLVWATDEHGAEKNLIIDGEHRWECARAVGMTVGPMVRLRDLKEVDAKALTVKLNQKRGDWDPTGLAELLADIGRTNPVVPDIAALSLGFSVTEMQAILGAPAEDARKAADAAAAADERTAAQDLAADTAIARWGVEVGARWRVLSRTVVGAWHTIVCGDSGDADIGDAVLAVAGRHTDMMWTDPPYGVSYRGVAGVIANDDLQGAALREFLRARFAAAQRVLVPGAAVYIAHPAGDLAAEFMLAMREVGWRVRQSLVWDKGHFVLGHADYHYAHEPILFGYTPGFPGAGRRGRGGSGWWGDNSQSSVLAFAPPHRNDLHPTMKPLDLVAAMLRNSSPPRGLVLDPFMGSGSTLLAAESIGRVGAGVDIDPRWVAATLDRCVSAGLTPERVLP